MIDRKFDVSHAAELDKPERHREIDPVALLRWAGLGHGEVVVDVGSGTGFFARAAAEIVGQRGGVLALDVNREMLLRFRQLGQPRRALISVCHDGNFPVRTSAVDFAIFGFVLHETDNPLRLLRETRRILRENARLIVVEWDKRQEDKGPPFAHRLSQQQVKALLIESGFVPTKTKRISDSYYAVAAERFNIRCCGPTRSVYF